MSLQGKELGKMDWDLNPKEIELLLGEHASQVRGLHRCSFEIANAPVECWLDVEDQPIMLWDDGVFVHGPRGDFERIDDYSDVPLMVLEMMREAFRAKIVIAQVQAVYEDVLEEFIDHPEHVRVKIVVFMGEEVRNPTYFLSSALRRLRLIGRNFEADGFNLAEKLAGVRELYASLRGTTERVRELSLIR